MSCLSTRDFISYYFYLRSSSVFGLLHGTLEQGLHILKYLELRAVLQQKFLKF
jgi:hypothetical protein